MEVRGGFASRRICHRDCRSWIFTVGSPHESLCGRSKISGALIADGRARMLAIMTLNVGYFLSVLGGTFLGELAVGRYAALEEH